MTASPDGTVSFRSTLTQAPGGKATGIVVPPEVIAALGQGKRPAVLVTLNDYEYRTTIGTMTGNQMIPVSAAVRTAAGISAGDPVDVKLAPDAAPRDVSLPADLAAALAANPDAAAFFSTLANSLQRYHVDNINGAKTGETRQRRVDKAVQLFLAKQPR